MTFPGQQPPAPGTTPPAAPPAPAAAPGGAMLTGAQLNIRIAHNDPSFPPELWGKTLGEAMNYYKVMKVDFMRNNPPGGQPPLRGEPQRGYTPPPAAAPAPAPTYTPPSFGYQPPQPAPAPAFDPAQMKQMIEEAVGSALGPVNQISAESVMRQVAARFPDWGTYHAEILSSVAGADPRQLLSPQLWESTYYHAKGRQLSDPNRQTPQYVPNNGDPFGNTSTPPDAIRTAPPPVFTESPMPSAPANANGANSNDAPEDFSMAARFGISVQEYRAWKDGRVPPIPTQNGGNGQGQPAPQTPYPAAGGWR